MEHPHPSYMGVLLTPHPGALLWSTPCAYLTKFSHDYSDRIRQDIPTKHLNFLLERGTEQQSYVQERLWQDRSYQLYKWNVERCECSHDTSGKTTWKKFRLWTGFEPKTFALPVQCSTNWAIKATWEQSSLGSALYVQWTYYSAEVYEFHGNICPI